LKRKYENNEIRKAFVEVYEQLVIDEKFQNQNQFAISIGTTHSVVSLILRSERKPSISMIELLVKTYNINANYLFGTSKKMYRGFHDSAHVNLN
jgi:transcriptional regulator with XRE-family HTH domain